MEEARGCRVNLVIVAGGLGSRLAPLTNYIPKFLVNIGKETGFVEQIRYWKLYQPESITVIVHSAYKDLVQAYYDMYFKGDLLHGQEFIVKAVDEANGSAHAIFSTCDHLRGLSVIFTWCDVLPGEAFNEAQLHDMSCAAFTNYDHPNRYDLVQTKETSGPTKGRHYQVPKIREDGRGGIFGIYYVQQYRDLSYENGQDFVEVLPKYAPSGWVHEIKIKSIIDWGDMPKLERARSTNDGARSFNSVEMHGDLVLKSALNVQGNTLIDREIKWYSMLEGSRSLVSRPSIWPANDRTSFVMTRVKGVPIWQLWPTLDNEGRAMVLTRLFQQLDLLHGVQQDFGNEIVKRDIKIEALDKLMNRYDEIETVVKSFGPVTWVNGQKLKMPFKPRLVIISLYERLIKHYEDVNKHSLIHGDLQMSNSMIDPDTLEITLIDPRGYFGKTDTFGVADYDIAKLYYSLSGYDLFNYSKDFHLSHNGLKDTNGQWNIEFTIPKPNLGGCEQIIKDRFGPVHDLWLAVIWIGLAQYIKSDPVKSVAAHFHGLAMAERVMSGESV